MSAGAERSARTWDSELPAFDAWLGDFLSSAHRGDIPATRTSTSSFAVVAIDDDDIDFTGIVKAEVEKRKPDIPGSCVDCIVPLAVKACKEAWDTLMSYCSSATDDKSEAACKHYREDPADFLISRVLRANINPIDGGYSYCWWEGKC